MKKIETKDIEFKFTMSENGNGEPGAFTGYASIFGVVDSYGDAVNKGAFKKTLRERKQFPLLWSHDISQPLGIISGVEDDTGLSVNGQLNLDVQRARELRSLMAQGAVTGLSIGYKTVKELIDRETGIRQLKEIDLWEISSCVFQACPDAVVSEVKGDKASDAEPDLASTPEIKPDLHLIDETIASIDKYFKS